MKGKFWRKALAVATSVLMLSGGVSVQPFADIFKGMAITASAQGTNVDLATLTGGYTAQDGDVLTGSTSHTVTIADNAKITLSNATINGGIVCKGSATIIVAGSNNVTGLVYHAGIRVGAPDTTLTINGNGVLNATGGNQGAGIGLDSSYDSNSGNYSSQSGGNIVIEGGTINATGVAQAAGIGCGYTHYSNPVTIGDITIKGGTVTAVGQNTAGGYGIGKGNGYAYYQTVGTITITTGITSVDASGFAGSFSENIVYKHGDTDVTENKDAYFAISDEGNKRLISTNISYYNVSVEDNITHGTVTASKTSAISGASITLSATPDYGYRLKSITVKDSAQNTISLNGMSFIMPAGNVTVSAVFEEIPITQTSVNYIDADGNEQTVTASVLDGELTELRDGWYVVDSTITIYDTLQLSGNVNIILADDRTMTINSDHNDAISGSATNLAIYGQSKGTGKISLVTENMGGSGIVMGTLTINGGELSWNERLCIYGTDPAQEIFTLNAGRIVKDDTSGDSHGTLDISSGKGSIKGGQVDLNTYNKPAIDLSNSELTLGYTKATDYIRINAGSFFYENGSVSIADGKTFTDGTNIYDSNTPSDTLRALSNVTLIPANAHNITAAPAENGTVTANEKEFEDDTVTLTVTPDTGYAVKSVKYNDTEITPVNGVYSFEMPAEDVTVTAVFGHTVAIDNNITNGTVSADLPVAENNEAVTLTVTPAAGYAVKSVTVNGTAATKVDDTHYSFTMPAENVTVSAEFEKQKCAVTLPDHMEITNGVVLTEGKADYGTEIIFKVSEGYTAANVKNGETELIPDLSGIYTVTVEGDTVITADIQKKLYELRAYGLRLNGDIGLDVYFGIDDSVIKDVTRMDITLPNGGKQTVYAADFDPWGNGLYCFSAKVAAKEMTDKVRFELYTNDTAPVCTADVSVRDAALVYLNDNEKSEDELVRAMLNYGAYSQLYFGHNIANLANAGYEYDDISAVTAAELGGYQYDPTTEDLPEGLSFAKVNLTLESETSLNLYFQDKTGANVSYTSDLGTVVVTEEKDFTKVAIKNIPAEMLGSYATVTITVDGSSYSVKYSPMTYCYNALTRDGKTKDLRDCMRAFYLYNKAAVAYIKSKLG